jgi:hypothetical protein
MAMLTRRAFTFQPALPNPRKRKTDDTALGAEDAVGDPQLGP